MLLKSSLPIVVALGGLSVASVDTQNACNEYAVLSARGTGEPQGPSNGFVGMIKTTLTTVHGGVEYDVKYPADANANQGTLIGARDIQDYISKSLDMCPNQKFAILGYSQGATVVLEALKALTGTPAESAVAAVLFIGNPFQVKGQPTTVDEKGGDKTRDKNGVLLPTKPSIGLSQHWVASGKALNICYQGDSVCTGIPMPPSPPHLLYGSTPSVQEMGSDFLISKLE